MSFRTLSFRHKTLSTTLGLVFFTAVAVACLALFSAKSILHGLGRHVLQATVNDEFAMVELYHKVLLEKLNVDLAFMEHLAKRKGGFAEAPEAKVSWTAVNQTTKDARKMDIPALNLGADPLDGQEFGVVDDLQKQAGGVATIFQVLPGKLLRVSTNVQTAEGKRAVGTYIPDDSPVYQAVVRGETYTGRAMVVGQWCLTVYKPMRDMNGKIVAVLFVGRPILTPELEKTLAAMSYAGKGYAYTYTSDGNFVYHPSKDIRAKNITRDLNLPALTEAKDGDFVEYFFKGDDKIAFVRHFQPWDWKVAISIPTNQLTFGLEMTLLKYLGSVGFVILVAAGLVTWRLTMTMTKPLTAMVDVANRVAAGNMDLRAVVKNRDEVGQLATAFNGLLDNLARNLAVNEAVLNTIPDPLFLVDKDSKVLLANEATLKLAGKKSVAEMGTMRCADIFNTPACNTENCPIERVKRGQPVGDMLIECQVAGQQTFVRPFAAVVRDKKGEELGYIELASIVTAEVQKERQLAGQMEHIRAVNEQIGTIAVQVASGSDRLSGQVQDVRVGADEQKSRITETATAVEEMNATILEVAKSAGDAATQAEGARSLAAEGAEVVRRSVASIDEAKQLASGLKGSMSSLGREVEAIGRVMTVIDDIAEQTNLLALNAAIEAARAGDAGRGFAVVADEVRKLAEKTMTATQEVDSAIKSIQESAMRNIQEVDRAVVAVQTAADLSEESGRALTHIVEVAQVSADQIRSIATASEEQSSASEEISRAVEEVSRISGRTAEGMDMSTRAVAELAELAGRLQRIAAG